MSWTFGPTALDTEPHTILKVSGFRAWDFSGRGAARAEDAQGTPAQSLVSPRLLAFEDSGVAATMRAKAAVLAKDVFRGTSLVRNCSSP